MSKSLADTVSAIDIVETDVAPEFANWGVIAVSPLCFGHSRPLGRPSLMLREFARQTRAALFREHTALPGFREMIDTLHWNEMR